MHIARNLYSMISYLGIQDGDRKNNNLFNILSPLLNRWGFFNKYSFLCNIIEPIIL